MDDSIGFKSLPRVKACDAGTQGWKSFKDKDITFHMVPRQGGLAREYTQRDSCHIHPIDSFESRVPLPTV
jgi:hypothetical protein